MKKLLFIFLLISCISAFNSNAQIANQPVRVEITEKAKNLDLKIIPIQKNGIIMLSDEHSKKNKYKWEITNFNNELKEAWNVEFNLNDGYVYYDYYFDSINNQLNLLYCEKTYIYRESNIKISKGKYSIVSIDIATQSVKINNGKFNAPIEIKDFKVINNKAFIVGCNTPQKHLICLQACLTCTTIPFFTGLSTFHFVSQIIHIDLEKNNSKIIPIILPGNTRVISTNINNNNLDVTIKNISSKYEQTFFINTYSEKGELITKTILKPKNNTQFTGGKKLDINNSNSIIIGTFANYKKKKFSNPASNENTGINNNATGLYICKTENENTEYIKYYNFTDFKSFIKKTSAKELEKLKRKQNKRTALNYNLLFHDIIINDKKEYIVIAEAYYPEYHNETVTTSGPNGPQTTTVRVFDGFRFTNALVCAFNEEGEKLWDQDFPIYNILTFNLKEKVKVLYNNSTEDITLVYCNRGEIVSQIFNNGEAMNSKTTDKIATNYEDDKVKSNTKSEIEYWYDNYFINWGYQVIKNKSKDEKKRSVFYMNKIEF